MHAKSVMLRQIHKISVIIRQVHMKSVMLRQVHVKSVMEQTSSSEIRYGANKFVRNRLWSKQVHEKSVMIKRGHEISYDKTNSFETSYD